MEQNGDLFYVFVLLSRYILESLRFHAVSVEDGIKHKASTRDTGRLANVYGIPWSFLVQITLLLDRQGDAMSKTAMFAV